MKQYLKLILAAALIVSMIAPAVATTAAVDGEQKRAELQIHQPHYIESGVRTEDAGNYTVYEAGGRVLQLQPRNFNGSQVVSVSIAEDVGSIRYDSSRNVFIFDSEGTEGTFRITWVVDEQVEKTVQDGNVTTTKNVTERREYVAVIRTENVNLAHVPASRLEQIKSDAENWSEVASLYGQVGSPNKPIEKKLQFGAMLVDAAYNPLKALSGDFGLAIQAVFFSAGGLIFFVLWNIPHLVRSRRLRKENKELKEKIGDYESIDEALDELFTEKRKRYLKEKSWNDWFDDRTAYWLRREFAPEPWSGFRRIMAMVSPSHLNGIVAGAMLDSGRYTAVVTYDPDSAFTDGGEDVVDVEQDVVSARMVEDADVEALESNLDENERLVSTSDELTDEISTRFDPATLDSDILRRHDVELRNVALPVANTPDEDDFVEQLNVSIPDDFETREHFAEVLETIVRKVAATDYSDAEGEIQPERDLANFLMGFAAIGGESYNQPYLRYIRDLMIHNLDRLDASERTIDVVEEARDRTDTGEKS